MATPWWRPPIYVWYHMQSGQVDLFWEPMGDGLPEWSRDWRFGDQCLMVPGTVDPLDDDYSPID